MDSDLKGHVALVTGGASGIGAAISKALLARGASVAVIDLNDAQVDAWCADADLSPVRSWQIDARDGAAVDRVCAEAADALGPVTILVNNVGGAGAARCTGIEDIADEDWNLVFDLNLGSAMRFSRALVPGMKAQGRGRIIHIGSSLMNGTFTAPGTARAVLPYVTMKSGYTGMTRQMSFDLAPHGITVNAVIPGLTLASPDALIAQRFATLPDEERNAINARIPVGRIATGEDIANAVLFFASPASSFVSGQLMWVTGGS